MGKELVNTIKKEIDSADVISFDIFDTLILRIVEKPEDIFKIMGKCLDVENFSDIRQEGQHNASIKAELSGHAHANFDEIYEYLEKEYSNINIDWKKAKALELQVEKDSFLLNSEIYEIYNYALSKNKKVIAISDMYFTKREIKEFLKHCGYEKFDEIYVSSDVGKTKYNNGEIFQYVIEKENVAPFKILHIGDNEISDVKNAEIHKIKAVHYNNIIKKNESEPNSLFLSINNGVINYLNHKNPDHTFWYGLGSSVGGSIYAGLIKWLQPVIEDKNSVLFFMARDGYNLYNLLEEFGVKNIKYFYTSRRSLLLPGITQMNKEDIELLPPYTRNQTIKEILSYLGLFDITDEDVCSVGFSGLEDTIKTDEDFIKLRTLYCKYSNYVLSICAKEREYAKKYLQSLNFFNANNVVFDSGWNGSSQFLLDRLLNSININKEVPFYYAGIFNSEKSKKQLTEKNYKSYFFNINDNNDIQEIIRIPVVIFELFFGAPENSVWRYSENKNGFEFENLEEDTEYKQGIFLGIKDYIKIVLPFINKYKIDIGSREAISGLVRLIQSPSDEEARTIGNVKNVDGFVANKQQMKYIAKLTKEDILKNGSVEIYWPQGLLNRSDIDDEVKDYIRKKFNIGEALPSKKYNEKIEILNKIKNYYRILKVVLKEEGPYVCAYKIKNKINNKFFAKIKNPYDIWIEENEEDILKVESLEYNPLISVIVPVYNVKEEQLKACLNSVINQTYKNWELCVVDDFSTWSCVKKVLKDYESNEKINIIYRKENGHISKATNDGIKVAKGEFIAFLDCDDILSPNALYEMAKKLNEKEYDFIYSDEDKISDDGSKRHLPFFKPDWSPDTFMNIMYTCHFSIYRKEIIEKAGYLNSNFDGAQDYEFTLRFIENTEKIGHISKILYHWREREESIANNMGAKPYAMEAMRMAKAEALKRKGIEGKIELIDDIYQYRVNYLPVNNPKISIIIPSKNNFYYLDKCVSGIYNNTNYKNFEIIIVDNGSSEDVKNKYEKLCEKYGCKYIYDVMEFNFSKMCNIGAKNSKGEVLLFLNDDVEVIEEEWLERMVGQAIQNHTGAVGAKLLYYNSFAIQHAGILNLKIGPSHALLGFDDRVPYYFCRNRVDYNYTAVTGACLMLTKEKFYNVGGFDEDFPIAYNDVDLCFSLTESGFFNILRNDVKLFHHESVSRGSDDIDVNKKRRLEIERENLYNKHPSFKENDKYYNKNLSQSRVDFSLNIITLECLKKSDIVENNKKYSLSKHIKYNIDMIKVDEVCQIHGWAFLDDCRNNILVKKYILLESHDKNYILSVKNAYRPDVNKAFYPIKNLSFSGFQCTFKRDDISKGLYDVRVCVEPILFGKKVITESICQITI